MNLLKRPEKPSSLSSEPASRDELNGILGRGSVFEGKLAFEGVVHLNGTFVGEISSKGTLIIGEGAKAQGTIDVGTLIINGEVSGHIRVAHLLEMHVPARVKASIVAPSLVIDSGVIFEGTSRMENLEAAAETPATPLVKPAAQNVKKAG
jgi:cytoskeletal protein CcmA (bactofilin family)